MRASETPSPWRPAKRDLRLGYATASLRSALLMRAMDFLPFWGKRAGAIAWRGPCVFASLGGLGDLFIQLPLIAGLLREAHERGLEASVVLRPGHAAIGRRLGWEVWEYENPLQHLFSRTLSPAVLRQALAQVADTRRRRIGLWVDLTGNAFNAAALRLGGVHALAAKITRGGRSLIRHPLPHVPYENEYAYRDRLADFLGCIPDPRVYRDLIDDKETRGSHVVLSITTGNPWKNWPLAHFEQVARAFPEETFWLVGNRGEVVDPAERAAAAALARLPNVRDRLDELSTLDLIAAIGTARAILTNDTASAHIANAYGVPGAVLFGPTAPETWAAPPGIGQLRVFQDRTCPFSPCGAQWGCVRPQDWCMSKVNVGSVIAHLRTALTGPDLDQFTALGENPRLQLTSTP